MNDLEKLSLDRIIEVSKEAFTMLSLLPYNTGFNYNDHILPISSKLNHIEQIAKALKLNNK